LATKKKKTQAASPMAPVQADRTPMPSLKVKKQKKTSRGK